MEGKKRMTKCRITVRKVTEYRDLMEAYELPLENACSMTVGDTFISEGERPEGLCVTAWETLCPFVRELCAGGGGFYGNWMKDPHSAMVSCNDGFRPVTFHLEAIDE